MSIFSDNIRFLREKKELTQQALASELIITRERYKTYESGASEPPIEVLLRISKFFHVSIDLLVSVDIRKYPIDDILLLPNNRIVFPVVVDSAGNNSIEVVTQKASMGYLQGYSDPEFIENLPTIYFPFLKNGKYRAFPGGGDSMPPFVDGSYIIGEYVEKIQDMKLGEIHVFVTLKGITIKRFVERKANSLTVCADNPMYDAYEIPLADILEIWEYASGTLPKDYKKHALENAMTVEDMFLELKKDIKKIAASIT
jgi:transcriptional regulator with XRE-family HTH domain